MKKLIILFVFSFLSICSYGQDKKDLIYRIGEDYYIITYQKEPVGRIYPSISQGEIILTVYKSEDLVYLIYDSEGKKLKESPVTSWETVISLFHLSKGSYFFFLQRKGEIVYSSKFLIQ